jgi:aminoglycoside 2''-adenylyltransferase
VTNQNDVSVMFEVLARAEGIDLPLWLESGWAIDARLGEITRQHSDIDLAFPAERQAEFITILQTLGCGSIEFNDYGFLTKLQGVILDCEPCELRGNTYEFDGLAGSCPPEKQGRILGREVRCLSWAAIYWDYLYYLEEVPRQQWRAYDHSSFLTVRNHLDAVTCHELEVWFAARK